MTMYMHGGNSHDRRKAKRAMVMHSRKQAAAIGLYVAPKLSPTQTADLRNFDFSQLPPGNYEATIRGEGVFLKIKEEPKNENVLHSGDESGVYAGTHSKGFPLETKADALQPGSFAIAKGAAKLAPVEGDADFRDYAFYEGGSVRHRKTKTVATALARRPGGMIQVHRRDNRKVEWAVKDCENWN